MLETIGTKFLGFANINQPPLGRGVLYELAADPRTNWHSAANPGPCAATPGPGDPEQLAQPFFTKFPYLGQIDPPFEPGPFQL